MNTYLDSIPGAAPAMFTHIERCILATKMPQYPCTPIEHIIYDADTYHFGAPDKRVKEEAKRLGADIGDWNSTTVELMQAHTFHTSFGKEVLSIGKAQNMMDLRGQHRQP